jgi:hypothetical protein
LNLVTALSCQAASDSTLWPLSQSRNGLMVTASGTGVPLDLKCKDRSMSVTAMFRQLRSKTLRGNVHI